MSHRGALITVAAAATLDLAAGSVFAAVKHMPEVDGLYWAIATATTVGYGDLVPHTSAGRALAVMVMLTVVPLFAATFSLFTSALTASHVRRHVLPHTKATQRIVADLYRHHLGHDHPDAPSRKESRQKESQNEQTGSGAVQPAPGTDGRTEPSSDGAPG